MHLRQRTSYKFFVHLAQFACCHDLAIRPEYGRQVGERAQDAMRRLEEDDAPLLVSKGFESCAPPLLVRQKPFENIAL